MPGWCPHPRRPCPTSRSSAPLRTEIAAGFRFLAGDLICGSSPGAAVIANFEVSAGQVALPLTGEASVASSAQPLPSASGNGSDQPCLHYLRSPRSLFGALVALTAAGARLAFFVSATFILTATSARPTGSRTISRPQARRKRRVPRQPTVVGFLGFVAGCLPNRRSRSRRCAHRLS